MPGVTPNDAEEDGTTLNSTNLNVLWGITFNVTSGEDGSQLGFFNINCNNSFSVSGVSSPYTTGFLPGSYQCTLTKDNYYDKTITFTADSDQTINSVISVKFHLTNEEHTWLEAIYNCLYSGNCSLYNLMLEINQTTTNIWQNVKPTDQSVILYENITNKQVTASKNLTINYTVSIPIKAGYTLGTYLPVRIGFWFLNVSNNITCFNQGDRPTGVIGPYCQPLITEVVGPMGGQINFTVTLRPNVSLGNYTLKRIIDIDPNNVWINYGQEAVGIVEVQSDSNSYGIAIEKTGENNPGINSQQQSASQQSSGGNSVTNVYNTYVTNRNTTDSSLGTNNKESPAGITGGATQNLLSGGNFIIIIIIVGATLIIFIISRTIKLKNR